MPRRAISPIPTEIGAQILDNTSAAPTSGRQTRTKGNYMSDSEVARLRRLRNSALRVRAVSRSLAAGRWATNDPLLSCAACSSWRIARTVSGHLRSHPYARYQKGAGAGQSLGNFALASYAALTTRSRMRALLECETQLWGLLRQLDDARALTWSPELSDAFGRSQSEIKWVVAALADETKTASVSQRLQKRRPAKTAGPVRELTPSFEGDWPYLAF